MSKILWRAKWEFQTLAAQFLSSVSLSLFWPCGVSFLEGQLDFSTEGIIDLAQHAASFFYDLMVE